MQFQHGLRISLATCLYTVHRIIPVLASLATLADAAALSSDDAEMLALGHIRPDLDISTSPLGDEGQSDGDPLAIWIKAEPGPVEKVLQTRHQVGPPDLNPAIEGQYASDTAIYWDPADWEEIDALAEQLCSKLECLQQALNGAILAEMQSRNRTEPSIIDHDVRANVTAMCARFHRNKTLFPFANARG